MFATGTATTAIVQRVAVCLVIGPTYFAPRHRSGFESAAVEQNLVNPFADRAECTLDFPLGFGGWVVVALAQTEKSAAL
jgi:hypothetical protein